MPTEFSPVDPESLLPRFGLKNFRPGQRDVVDTLAAGQDVLCVMPTGGGKSLCYQLPSLARPGTTIVISPLIALMKDQVDALERIGIAARLINSTQSLSEQEDAMSAMARGELDLIYVAPERLRNGRFLEAIAASNVSLLAVDEAHCVSEWGHDFRPDYSRLGQVRKRYLSGVQTIALTATATPLVREDVCRLLELDNPRVFVTGFARTNLRFSVKHSKSDSEKERQLTEFVKAQEGAGIIYAATRKMCEELGEWLPEKTRRPIGVYHGGMEPQHRRVVQEQFMSGELSAIVATNAFGMGIDKSDIRYVAHFQMPGTLEAYYQEAGRAGRDGQLSDCALFFSYQDRYIQEFFIENRYPSPETVRKVYEYLLSRPEDPIELTLEQVRTAIKSSDSSEAIGASQTLLAKAGVLKRLDSSNNQILIRIDSDAPTLLDFLPREAKVRRRVMSAVQQVIGKRRGEDVFVRPKRLMDLANVDREKLMRNLRELSRLHAFDYVPPFRGRAVHFTQRDVPFENLQIDFDELARRKAAEYDKLEAVIGFARTSGCRQRIILDYFGDPESSNCGMCDRCDVGGADAKSADASSGIGVDPNALLTGVRVTLSGVTRMHGRFGKNMVAQMLSGSLNKRIQQWRLDRLSTYGMLSKLKQTEVVEIIDALIQTGLVEQREVDQRRPTVEISEAGKRVMHMTDPLPASFTLKLALGKRLAMAAASVESADVESADVESADRPAENETSASETTETSTMPGDSQPASDSSDLAAHAAKVIDETLAGPGGQEFKTVDLEKLLPPAKKLQQELAEALKRWRRRTAAAQGIPAFRVLTNATIDRIAESAPQTTGQLEAISGVGDATIEQFGYDILQVIAEHQCETGQSAPEPTKTTSSQSAHDPKKVLRADPPDASGNANSPSTPSRPESANDVVRPDEYWTWRLIRDGYSVEEVCRIRGISESQVNQHLESVSRN
ncbi:ATP-dependent DNA helicase RecQ [Stieleria varia]|nr:ATP-dependent DNA helicase RecQ [Stieleria varia]